MSEHCTCATSDYCQVHDQIMALRAEVANYEVLKRAVNESTNECSTQCDEHGHAGDCPANNSARWLEDQQREIESLRAEVDALKARLTEAIEIFAEPWVIEDGYGSQCREFDPNCPTCRAWRWYETVHAAREDKP